MKNFMIALVSLSIRHKTAKYTVAPMSVVIARYAMVSVRGKFVVVEIFINCGIMSKTGTIATAPKQYFATDFFGKAKGRHFFANLYLMISKAMPAARSIKVRYKAASNGCLGADTKI